MELTQKDIKFLTVMNETRLFRGKMFGRYFDEVSKVFTFTDTELKSSVKKLVGLGMLESIEAGGGEQVYFHTLKVKDQILDKNLLAIRH